MIIKYGRSGAVLPSIAPGAQLYEQNSYRATAKQKGQLKEGRVKQGNALPRFVIFAHPFPKTAEKMTL